MSKIKNIATNSIAAISVNFRIDDNIIEMCLWERTIILEHSSYVLTSDMGMVNRSQI